jgi:hypothetical protein
MVSEKNVPFRNIAKLWGNRFIDEGRKEYRNRVQKTEENWRRITTHDFCSRRERGKGTSHERAQTNRAL